MRHMMLQTELVYTTTIRQLFRVPTSNFIYYTLPIATKQKVSIIIFNYKAKNVFKNTSISRKIFSGNEKNQVDNIIKWLFISRVDTTTILFYLTLKANVCATPFTQNLNLELRSKYPNKMRNYLVQICAT